MKLDNSCLRQVMLTIEEMLVVSYTVSECDQLLYDDPKPSAVIKPLMIEKLFNNERLSSYSREEIMYALLKLSEMDYIASNISLSSEIIQGYMISDITADGHTFLKTVRDDRIWAKVSKAIEKYADMSLPVILKLALEAIKSV